MFTGGLFNITVAKATPSPPNITATGLFTTKGFDDVHKAIGREKQLKGWSRMKKIALIESKNPRWEDFAESWGAQMAFAGESIKGQ